MAKSITSINSLLLDLQKANSGLLIQLQQLGFDTQLHMGNEQEYTVKTLVYAIDTLARQLLSITVNRALFIQLTSHNERIEIDTCLQDILNCLQQTIQV